MLCLVTFRGLIFNNESIPNYSLLVTLFMILYSASGYSQKYFQFPDSNTNWFVQKFYNTGSDIIYLNIPLYKLGKDTVVEPYI